MCRIDWYSEDMGLMRNACLLAYYMVKHRSWIFKGIKITLLLSCVENHEVNFEWRVSCAVSSLNSVLNCFAAASVPESTTISILCSLFSIVHCENPLRTHWKHFCRFGWILTRKYCSQTIITTKTCYHNLNRSEVIDYSSFIFDTVFFFCCCFVLFQPIWLVIICIVQFLCVNLSGCYGIRSWVLIL